jgi:hypothetical protein
LLGTHSINTREATTERERSQPTPTNAQGVHFRRTNTKVEPAWPLDANPARAPCASASLAAAARSWRPLLPAVPAAAPPCRPPPPTPPSAVSKTVMRLRRCGRSKPLTVAGEWRARRINHGARRINHTLPLVSLTVARCPSRLRGGAPLLPMLLPLPQLTLSPRRCRRRPTTAPKLSRRRRRR